MAEPDSSGPVWTDTQDQLWDLRFDYEVNMTAAREAWMELTAAERGNRTIAGRYSKLKQALVDAYRQGRQDALDRQND